MHKAMMNPTQEYQFEKNFKLVQTVFSAVGIERPIEIQRLTKANFQAHLELLQWLKRHFDGCPTPEPYDAAARRTVSRSKSCRKPPATPRRVKGEQSDEASRATPSITHTPGLPVSVTNRKRPLPANSQKENPKRQATGRSVSTKRSQSTTSSRYGSSRVLQPTTRHNAGTHEQVEDFVRFAKDIEAERNFYFKKLRQIEEFVENTVVTDQLDKPLVIAKIREILCRREQNPDDENEEEETKQPQLQQQQLPVSQMQPTLVNSSIPTISCQPVPSTPTTLLPQLGSMGSTPTPHALSQGLVTAATPPNQTTVLPTSSMISPMTTTGLNSTPNMFSSSPLLGGFQPVKAEGAAAVYTPTTVSSNLYLPGGQPTATTLPLTGGSFGPQQETPKMCTGRPSLSALTAAQTMEVGGILSLT
eukprot:TRINITY_DN62465_c0_g1_i2.p1 TRINITY_DN62465_c0_g1~~TRINITY_DN62465_c0_g1_i2.p1  ORF type:complete len:472 (+),score=34.84 TRINITY_DN62465_c0_g1_i2:166-1416(+)